MKNFTYLLASLVLILSFNEKSTASCSIQRRMNIQEMYFLLGKDLTNEIFEIPQFVIKKKVKKSASIDILRVKNKPALVIERIAEQIRSEDKTNFYDSENENTDQIA